MTTYGQNTKATGSLPGFKIREPAIKKPKQMSQDAEAYHEALIKKRVIEKLATLMSRGKRPATSEKINLPYKKGKQYPEKTAELLKVSASPSSERAGRVVPATPVPGGPDVADIPYVRGDKEPELEDELRLTQAIKKRIDERGKYSGGRGSGDMGRTDQLISLMPGPIKAQWG